MTVFNMNAKCFYCGVSLGKKATKDHVRAKSPMKDDDPRRQYNTVAACFPCNYAKNTDDVEKFRARLERLCSAPVVFFGEKQVTNVAKVIPPYLRRGVVHEQQASEIV